MLKRIRIAIGGLKGGLLPREVAAALAPHVNSPDLSKVVSKGIESRVSNHLSRLRVERVVRDEKTALDKEWADRKRRVRLAPGAEIVEEVFRHFGSEYKKPRDTACIARHMNAEEISPEIRNLIKRAVALPSREQVYPDLKPAGRTSSKRSKTRSTRRSGYCGMSPDEDPLTFLLALNGELTARKAEDRIVIGSGLPPDVEDSQPFVTTDSVKLD